MIKEIVYKILPESFLGIFKYIKNELLDGYARNSYSQEGEDLILMRFFEKKESGFYVDVGAHHPKRFSNTYIFYKKGWRGINIDANPGSMVPFRRKRKRDINLEIPISENPEKLKYYIFNEPALNGFSEKISESRNGLGEYKIESVVEMQTQRLDQVLDENMPANTKIDFLSVDVEGLDFEVIRSLDINKYAPTFILIEILGSDLKDLLDSEISSYLSNFGYALYAKAINTVFFKKEGQEK